MNHQPEAPTRLDCGSTDLLGLLQLLLQAQQLLPAVVNVAAQLVGL